MMKKRTNFIEVKFEAKGRPVIPDFTEAKGLHNGTHYELALPDADSIESITLKKDADPSITISNRDDIEKILDALANTRPTTISGEIGTPVCVVQKLSM